MSMKKPVLTDIAENLVKQINSFSKIQYSLKSDEYNRWTIFYNNILNKDERKLNGDGLTQMQLIRYLQGIRDWFTTEKRMESLINA
jgi:hypothetical protein